MKIQDKLQASLLKQETMIYRRKQIQVFLSFRDSWSLWSTWNYDFWLCQGCHGAQSTNTLWLLRSFNSQWVPWIFVGFVPDDNDRLVFLGLNWMKMILPSLLDRDWANKDHNYLGNRLLHDSFVPCLFSEWTLEHDAALVFLDLACSNCDWGRLLGGCIWKSLY